MLATYDYTPKLNIPITRIEDKMYATDAINSNLRFENANAVMILPKDIGHIRK